MLYVNCMSKYLFYFLFFRLDFCGPTKKNILQNYQNLLIVNKIVVDLTRKISVWTLLIIFMLIISSMYTVIKLNVKCGIYPLLGITITGFITTFNSKLILQRAFIIYKNSCDFHYFVKNVTYLNKAEKLRLKSYDGMYLYLFNTSITSDLFPVLMDKIVLSILTTLLLTFRD